MGSVFFDIFRVLSSLRRPRLVFYPQLHKAPTRESSTASKEEIPTWLRATRASAAPHRTSTFVPKSLQPGRGARALRPAVSFEQDPTREDSMASAQRCERRHAKGNSGVPFHVLTRPPPPHPLTNRSISLSRTRSSVETVCEHPGMGQDALPDPILMCRMMASLLYEWLHFWCVGSERTGQRELCARIGACFHHAASNGGETRDEASSAVRRKTRSSLLFCPETLGLWGTLCPPTKAWFPWIRYTWTIDPRMGEP